MQILGKRSKVLVMAISTIMLIAVGVSFAMWDTSAVKATSGNSSTYANAKVGDVIEFGRYYQTGEKVSDAEDAEYKKTPIEWLVVDKDERIGQLTLMSKYILAAGSYFGNHYYNDAALGGYHYQKTKLEVGANPYNQAYIESTARAFLNNLERRDLGGDSFEESQFKTSATSSDSKTGVLLTSVGFSNRKYTINGAEYQRPIKNVEYRNRPATRGFFDEAFTNEEKTNIVPKTIPGYIGFRWPTGTHEPANMTYVEGAMDKVWLPSATELNIMSNNEEYTNPSDEASSTVFEYFKGNTGVALQNALKAERTKFVKDNSKAMNFSIPVYKYQSEEINEDIHTTMNSLDYYWTRSPMPYYCNNVRYVIDSGIFKNHNSDNSHIGVRPCIILKY